MLDYTNVCEPQQQINENKSNKMAQIKCAYKAPTEIKLDTYVTFLT